MYKYNVYIKSGTGGHFDEDGCDNLIAELVTPFLPRIGEIISLEERNKENKLYYQSYLIRDIKYWVQENNQNNGIDLYVIPIPD